MTTKHLNLYLISDSSGETVIAITKAAVVQFSEINIEEKLFLLVRSQSQVDEFISEYQQKPGIVMYTMGNSHVKDYFLRQCEKLLIPVISPLDNIVSFISEKINIDPSDTRPGKYKSLDKEYYDRIESINFAIHHDDGQHTANYENADIVLLGVSRTSKSPTSLYLGQRGYRVANYPVILGLPLNIPNLEKLLEKSHPILIGLTTSSYNLSKIRTARLALLCKKQDKISQSIVDKYIENTAIKEEITYAKNIFMNLKIPIIDVTNKAIEESAAEIINIYSQGERN